MSSAPHPTLPAVPLLDFAREYNAQRDDLLAAITAVCDSQRYILGPAVTQFEAEAAAACGTTHGIGCASGTDALWLALAAAGIGPGDAVITTPFSFFATVSAILRAGATPVLADVDPRTYNLSPTAAEIALGQAKAKGLRVRALLPVHLFGQCADMDALTALAQAHGLRVIEDAAQAFGAAWNGTPAGAFGDAAAFSFYPTKNLAAMGDAGLVTTGDDAVADHAGILRAHGMRVRYFHEEVGWNSRLDSLQAAVLSVKLRHLPAGNARRRELAARYDRLFTAAGLAAGATAEGVVLPYNDPRATHVFHQYVVRVTRRDELRAYLAAHQIGSEIYYPLPLHLQQSLKFLGYSAGDFPIAEAAAAEVLALPMYPYLREAEQDTVVAAIRGFYA